MRKIQIAISWDLCIRLTWNLTGSCGQQQRHRGWSRMLLNNSEMVDVRHFENRYIIISRWKITGFWWNFVHSSRFWTGWTSRDQKWKSCIGQTPSSTERISCFYRNCCSQHFDLYYLCKGEVMWSVWSVCHSFVLSVCEQDYSKSNLPISWKLGVMIGPTSRKNLLIFSDDLVPDTDSGSRFHFSRHSGIFDLLAFLVQSPADFHDCGRSDWHRPCHESTLFCEQSSRHPRPNPD